MDMFHRHEIAWQNWKEAPSVLTTRRTDYADFLFFTYLPLFIFLQFTDVLDQGIRYLLRSGHSKQLT